MHVEMWNKGERDGKDTKKKKKKKGRKKGQSAICFWSAKFASVTWPQCHTYRPRNFHLFRAEELISSTHDPSIQR